MTKALTMAMITVLSLLAQAEQKAEWVNMYELTEETNTQMGFEIIQKKYPKIFGKFDPKVVYRANITVTMYQFKGPHTCAPNDLRLMMESSSYGACVKTNGNGSCFQAAARLPALKDPCFYN